MPTFDLSRPGSWPDPAGPAGGDRADAGGADGDGAAGPDDPDGPDGGASRRPHSRPLLVGGGVLVVGAVVAALLGGGDGSGEDTELGPAVEVATRDLATSLDEAGTLQRSSEHTVAYAGAISPNEGAVLPQGDDRSSDDGTSDDSTDPSFLTGDDSGDGDDGDSGDSGDSDDDQASTTSSNGTSSTTSSSSTTTAPCPSSGNPTTSSTTSTSSTSSTSTTTCPSPTTSSSTTTTTRPPTTTTTPAAPPPDDGDRGGPSDGGGQTPTGGDETGGGSDPRRSPSGGEETAGPSGLDGNGSDGSDGGDGDSSEQVPSATLTGVLPVGTMADRGSVLFTADDQPVIALIGDLPAWRTLEDGVADGADVRQLEENLAALGYGAGLDVDDTFTADTAAAVEAWETALGREDPDGTVAIGDIVFLSGPGEVLGHDAEVGDTLEPGSAVLTVGSEQRIVVADVAVTSVQTESGGGWAAGSTVELEWADATTTTGTVFGTGRDVNDDGEVDLIVAVPAGTEGAGERRSGAEAMVTLVDARRDGVVAVPVAAIVDHDGSPAVRVAHDDGPDEVVPVETGLVADGWIEITSGLTGTERIRLPA